MLRLDLFTCNRATLESWASSVLSVNSIDRGNLEIQMPGFVSLPGMDIVDLGLLLSALAGLPAEAALAGGMNAVESLPLAMNDPGRPSLVVVLRDHAVRTFAETALGDDPVVIETWTALADLSHEVNDSTLYLTAETAAKIRSVCSLACDMTRDSVYAHVYVDPLSGHPPLVPVLPIRPRFQGSEPPVNPQKGTDHA